MNENATSPPPAPSSSPAPIPSPVATSPAAPKRRRWLLYGCGGILGLLLLIVLTVAITIWYIQRPIRPVVLSPQEKAAVEAKLERIHAVPNDDRPAAKANDDRRTRTGERTAPNVERPATPAAAEPDRLYVPGAKVLRLTEREINGLLNDNTDLGNTVRIEFARDAINAYVATPIPDDVPMLGGKMFRARGRFRISVGNGKEPVAVLEDVTVFGLSLPKAWLGGIKGENLLSDAVGRQNGRPALRGVKSLRVEPGSLVLEVED